MLSKSGVCIYYFSLTKEFVESLLIVFSGEHFYLNILFVHL